MFQMSYWIRGLKGSYRPFGREGTALAGAKESASNYSSLTSTPFVLHRFEAYKPVFCDGGLVKRSRAVSKKLRGKKIREWNWSKALVLDHV